MSTRGQSFRKARFTPPTAKELEVLKKDKVKLDAMEQKSIKAVKKFLAMMKREGKREKTKMIDMHIRGINWHNNTALHLHITFERKLLSRRGPAKYISFTLDIPFEVKQGKKVDHYKNKMVALKNILNTLEEFTCQSISADFVSYFHLYIFGGMKASKV